MTETRTSGPLNLWGHLAGAKPQPRRFTPPPDLTPAPRPATLQERIAWGAEQQRIERLRAFHALAERLAHTGGDPDGEGLAIMADAGMNAGQLSAAIADYRNIGRRASLETRLARDRKTLDDKTAKQIKLMRKVEPINAQIRALVDERIALEDGIAGVQRDINGLDRVRARINRALSPKRPVGIVFDEAEA